MRPHPHPDTPALARMGAAGHPPSCYLGRMETPRAPRITIRKAALGPEDDRLDREFWASIPPEERVEETWRLTLELCE